jgi:hypothetical protein
MVLKLTKFFETDYPKNNDRSVLVKLGYIWFHKVKYGIFVCSAIDFFGVKCSATQKRLGTTDLRGSNN